LEKDVLVPEIVEHEGLKIGRFEVTGVQFAQFDKDYKVKPGQENYPAHGVSFEKAKAYCDWLSKQTGRVYRLPNAEEAEELYGEPDEEENTLDSWAGYTVNPDDAERLRDKIKELGSSLLKEVGSAKGQGENEQVFDLGGNVAEWVDEDGKGKAHGGSADAPRDVRTSERKPWMEYVGFRVVVGKPKKD
jgi:formylglycine-generating enzyme required for sulfatase activity